MNTGKPTLQDGFALSSRHSYSGPGDLRFLCEEENVAPVSHYVQVYDSKYSCGADRV